MPTILTAAPGGGISMQDPDHGAQVGRWCKPPEVPDRCYTCYDPETLAHRLADGYVERQGWRYGCCQRCRPAGAIRIEERDR